MATSTIKYLFCLLLLATVIIADSYDSEVVSDYTDYSTDNVCGIGQADAAGLRSALTFAISIPSGATIDSAWLVVDAFASQTNDVNILIYCEGTIHPTPVTDNTTYDAATRTTASTAVTDLANWTGDADGLGTAWYRIPDGGAYATDALQEVINSGAIDSVQFFLDDNPGSGDFDIKRLFWDGDAGPGCSLVVYYTPTGGAPSDTSTVYRAVSLKAGTYR